MRMQGMVLYAPQLPASARVTVLKQKHKINDSLHALLWKLYFGYLLGIFFTGTACACGGTSVEILDTNTKKQRNPNHKQLRCEEKIPTKPGLNFILRCVAAVWVADCAKQRGSIDYQVSCFCHLFLAPHNDSVYDLHVTPVFPSFWWSEAPR